MKNCLKIGIAIFTLFGTNAFAEGNCPAGQYPIGGGNGGWVGCAPIPGYGGGGGQSYGGGGGAKLPKWSSSYGALVLGKSRIDGVMMYNFSTKYSSELAAQDAAFSACTDTSEMIDCKGVFTFANGFIAVSSGEDGKIYWGAHKKEDKAKKVALDECKKLGNKDCKVFKTGDSSAIKNY